MQSLPVSDFHRRQSVAFALASLLLRRALQSLLVLVCVSLLALTLLKTTPGDYFDSARVNPGISADALQAMRTREGIDQPLPVLYWSWLRSCMHGDGGYSFAYNMPVGAILKSRIRNTLLLTGSAMLLAWAVALPAGITAALAKQKGITFLINSGTPLLLAVPEIVVTLLVLLVATNLAWSVSGLLLPAACLAVTLFPVLISHIEVAVKETAQAPFVTAARQFNISPSRMLLRWILPASANPMISLFGLSLGLLMSSSLIVEGVFSWPGLGLFMLQAIADRDIFPIVDSAVISAGFLLAGNLAADALLYLSDPRIRAQ